jgi:peptidyl-prolyl cis-trans isomerase D
VLQSMRGAAKYVWWFLIVAFIGSFLLYETSGLAGRSPVTQNTAVATVNGEEVLLTAWQAAVANMEQQEQQRLGRGLTLDERRMLEDQAFDQMVTDILLRQEYARRGISVTDEEVRQAAQYAPPPEAMQAEDLQTDGQFDINKYRRLLASPMARQSGMLAGLEAYYRSEIPKQKLFDQVSADVFVTEERAWQIYRDRHDSARVTYATIRTDNLTDTAVTITDAEIRQYYDRNPKRFDRPGRAVISLITIPRTVTAADTAAARARVERLREEIIGGASFEEVAQRESMDSVSGAQGGSLGVGGRDRFVSRFEDAAYALRPGELSQPVLTQFGWHLIRVDSRKGDTLDLRHILIAIGQSDSSATITDRRADSVASLAGNVEDGRKFDEAAQRFGLSPASVIAIEREPLVYAGRQVPSVSAWAFSGVRAGETSELFDAIDAYYLARVDSLQAGGTPPLDLVRDDIRRRLRREKLIEKLMPQAQALATAARSSSLEAAAAAQRLPVETTQRFARVDLVPGLGQFTQAIGAAFTTPIGQISPPVRTADAVAVLRVDGRTEASRTAFEIQKDEQRTLLAQQLRQQRVQEYMVSLRESAKLQDHRARVLAQLRRQSDI